jgi:hypothetical protein
MPASARVPDVGKAIIVAAPVETARSSSGHRPGGWS